MWLPLTYRLFTEQQTEEMLNDSQLKRNVCPDSFHMQWSLVKSITSISWWIDVITDILSSLRDRGLMSFITWCKNNHLKINISQTISPCCCCVSVSVSPRLRSHVQWINLILTEHEDVTDLKFSPAALTISTASISTTESGSEHVKYDHNLSPVPEWRCSIMCFWRTLCSLESKWTFVPKSAEIPSVPEILHSQEQSVRPTWQPEAWPSLSPVWRQNQTCRTNSAELHPNTAHLANCGGVVKVREASLWLEGHQLTPRPAG